ncbi:MAG TPA: sulfate ABC transporter permease subunit CysT [Myxococcota bacterium]|nr:sulfate ABC transporter permease subunit CysT [Myxococcota bacterium]
MSASKSTSTTRRRPHRPIPGLSLSLGIVFTWVGLIVIIPLAALVLMSLQLDGETFFATVTSSRALSAFGLSFGAAFVAALINLVFGVLLAWVLVRYRFPGRGLLDALMDLPFALPTAVAGIALTAAFSPNGPIGSLFMELDIKTAYSRLGVTIALVFISLPFVVRTVQPVLEQLQPELEEAAATLGATRGQTFLHVILPALRPAMLTGFALAFARGLGEYGSVVFISANLPNKTEIIPLLIYTKLEQFQYAEAAALAVVMLVFSFVLLFVIQRLQKRRRRSYKKTAEVTA